MAIVANFESVGADEFVPYRVHPRVFVFTWTKAPKTFTVEVLGIHREDHTHSICPIARGDKLPVRVGNRNSRP